MNEKPKRRVIGWWQSLEWYDKGLAIAVALSVLAIVMVAVALHSDHLARNFAPCSELGGREVSDLPARCYEYYGLRLPE